MLPQVLHYVPLTKQVGAFYVNVFNSLTHRNIKIGYYCTWLYATVHIPQLCQDPCVVFCGLSSDKRNPYNCVLALTRNSTNQSQTKSKLVRVVCCIDEYRIIEHKILFLHQGCLYEQNFDLWVVWIELVFLSDGCIKEVGEFYLNAFSLNFLQHLKQLKGLSLSKVDTAVNLSTDT